MQLTRTEVGRFFTFFIPGHKDSCWPWLGGTSEGYGVFKTQERPQQAHRIAYLLEYGTFDFSLHVLHTCDNPPCVNPNHLFLGTHTDNMRDKTLKGRLVLPDNKGELNGQTRFSDSTIDEIRQLYSTREFTQSQLAKQFNMSSAQMSRILNGESR